MDALALKQGIAMATAKALRAPLPLQAKVVVAVAGVVAQVLVDFNPGGAERFGGWLGRVSGASPVVEGVKVEP